MKLYNTFTACEKTNVLGRAVTIGNFDGCHLGHQRLFARTLTRARELGVRSLAVSFEPNPKYFFTPELEADRLYTAAQKLRLLAEFGFDELLIQPFDAGFSQMPHEEFYATVVKQELRAKVVIIGDDFRFGFRRLGNNLYLKENTDRDKIELHIATPEVFKQEPISSSRIRRVVRAGQVEAAADMLGRPYALEGEIMRGARLGRTIGVPTANLGGVEQLLPATGVYAGYVWYQTQSDAFASLSTLPRQRFPAVFNIGSRPTVHSDDASIKLEGHIIDSALGQDELYGKRAVFYLTQRLRDEIKFASLEALKAQIQADIQFARRSLA